MLESDRDVTQQVDIVDMLAVAQEFTSFGIDRRANGAGGDERRQRRRPLFEHEVGEMVQQIDRLPTGESGRVARGIDRCGVGRLYCTRQSMLCLYVVAEGRPHLAVDVVENRPHCFASFFLLAGSRSDGRPRQTIAQVIDFFPLTAAV